MLKVNIPLLMSALCETEVFSLPEMNTGTQYLFDNLYKRLENGDDVHLSELDFDCFKLDDVSALNTIYDEEIEKNRMHAHKTIISFREMKPVCLTVDFA